MAVLATTTDVQKPYDSPLFGKFYLKKGEGCCYKQRNQLRKVYMCQQSQFLICSCLFINIIQPVLQHSHPLPCQRCLDSWKITSSNPTSWIWPSFSKFSATRSTNTRDNHIFITDWTNRWPPVCAWWSSDMDRTKVKNPRLVGYPRGMCMRWGHDTQRSIEWQEHH